MTTKPEKYIAKDGQVSWRIRWRVPGNPARQSFTHPDRAMVNDMRDEIEERGHRIYADDPRVVSCSLVTGEKPQTSIRTLRLAMLDWIENGSGARPNAKDNYRHWLDHQLAELGRRPMDLIEPTELVQLFRRLASTPTRRGKPLASNTLSCIWGNIAATWKWEIAAGRQHRDQPAMARQALAQELTRGRVYADKFLTHEEWAELEPHLADDPDLAAFLDVMLATGGRWQEVAALRVGDLKLDRKFTVRFDKAVETDRNTGRPALKGCKAGSERTLVVDAQFAARMRAYVEGRSSGALLFPGPKGDLLAYTTFYKTPWRKFVRRAKAAGFTKPLTLHMLRHTHGSWILDLTGDLHAVSIRLGHAKISTTANIYMHRLPRGDDKTRQTLEEMWGDVAEARKQINRRRFKAI